MLHFNDYLTLCQYVLIHCSLSQLRQQKVEMHQLTITRHHQATVVLTDTQYPPLSYIQCHQSIVAPSNTQCHQSIVALKDMHCHQ